MQQANQKVSGGDDYQPVGLYHPDNYPLREQSFETQADSRAHLKPTTYPPTADPEKGNTYGSRPALSNNSSWTPLKNLEEESVQCNSNLRTVTELELLFEIGTL